MRYDENSPNAHRIMVYRDGKPVGLVKCIDMTLNKLWRYVPDVRGGYSLIEEDLGRHSAAIDAPMESRGG